MIKSEAQIEDDVYNLLKPYFKTVITGGVYKDESRPGDSHAEDAVIAVSNADANQFQEGHVYVNIYVPDRDNNSRFFTPNKERLAELSALHETLCEYMNIRTTNEYTFFPGKAARLVPEPDIQQHFVSMDIKFKRTTF